MLVYRYIRLGKVVPGLPCALISQSEGSDGPNSVHLTMMVGVCKSSAWKGGPGHVPVCPRQLDLLTLLALLLAVSVY